MRRIIQYIPLCLILALYIVLGNIAIPLKEAVEVATGNYFNHLTVVLDAGHGGKDNGASANGILEDELNLAVTLKLKDKLEMMGATVLLTRDDDYDLASDSALNRKREDMAKRAEIINTSGAVMFLSIHMNKYSSSSVSGAQVFYRVNDDASKLLAECLQAKLGEYLGTNKHVKIGNYYILNETDINGVLIECGFISNNEEAQRLQDDSYQDKLVSSIIKGIYEYIELTSANVLR
ncbi:MAG: N-acetylmuramoyl-L-alanine amidase [Erysipelotrichales bacterium]|nr:N-acetylmuramoyl-L-alanine amidase [Erysipelotrichales bacterium]